jgi:hypothetical protein
VFVLDSTELYTAGFLPWHVAAQPQKTAESSSYNKSAQPIELYDEIYDETADDLARNTRSRRNHGIVSYFLFENVPVLIH